MRHLARALVCSTTLMMVMSWGSLASALLIDDFADGTNDGWTETSFGLSEGNTPIHDASSGRYQLGSTDVSDALYSAVSSGYLASRDNETYRDGTVQVSLILDNEASSFVVSLRANLSEGTGAIEPGSYNFAGNNALDRLYLIRIGGTTDCALDVAAGNNNCYFGAGGGHYLGSEGIEAGVEYIIQASAVGTELAMKFWEATEPEPTSPQLTALTTEHPVSLTGTGINLALYVSQAGTTVSGSFDDIAFTPIPEPSTALLLGIGLAGLGMRRRTRKDG